MTLFFDTKVQFLDSEAVSTISLWHNLESVFAVASYSQNRGGSVTIFDEQGEPLRDVTYPVHPISQATALAWHPEKTLLVTGWENGEVFAWVKGRREFYAVKGLHKAPIVCLAFSEQGGRLVSADAMGILTGWRSDSQNQFLTAFTHELKDPVLHITFRRTLRSENSELTNLAKAAVAGDESALDTLTNWRPKTAARSTQFLMGVKDNQSFYVGTQNGVLYYLNQQGTCLEVMHLASAPIIQLLWHPLKDAVVALLDDMTVVHYCVEGSGVLAELDRVKLSGRIPGHTGFMAWTYGHALAIIVGDLTVRIWDMETSDNFLLPIEGTSKKSAKSTSGSGMEIFTCLAYSPTSQTICAGTSHGNLFSWHRTNNYEAVEEDQGQVVESGRAFVQWQLKNKSNVRGSIKQCSWGLCDVVTPCILLNCITNVYVMKEQPLIVYHGRNVVALQRTANSLHLSVSTATIPGSERSCLVHSDIPITDLAASEKFLVLTNGRRIISYQLVLSEEASNDNDKDKDSLVLSVKPLNSFTASNQKLLLHEDRILVLDGESVRIMSLSGGVTLQELSFKSREGSPIGMDLNRTFLALFTMNGFVRLYDVSRHEPRLICPPSGTMRTGYDLLDNFGEFIAVKASASGSHLCMLIATENLLPDGKLYVWHVQQDQLMHFDFFFSPEVVRSDKFFTKLPVSFGWDSVDNRLLATEVKCIQQRAVAGSVVDKSRTTGGGRVVSESQVFVMFVAEKGQGKLNELEVIRLSPGEQMISLSVPHVVTLKINEIRKIPLRDFKGLENCDPHTSRMVLDFSLNIAQGNMDQAFRNIRSIQSEAVWENLARMCVQTRRLDVAKVCLGHLKRAASARALRLAMQDHRLEEDAKVAVLAIELKMIEEAAELYKKCGRYDLLNMLYQAAGRYEEAIKVTEQFDRVHLKNTYFKYGEWLRDTGDHQKAIKYFDKANSSVANIRQLLIDDPVALKKTMQNSTDRSLLNWWAQYVESTGDMDAALKVYQRAENYHSQVRLLCYMGQLAKADALAKQCGDRAACYHLARHYENIERIQDAIQFYIQAQTYGNAVRICKERHLADELWTAGGMAQGRDKVSAAAYFEEQGDFKRAVELYHRAGMLHKAVEMAFASQQPETLQVIAGQLDPKSDSELVNRCAEFFLEIGQNYKAVQLLANTRQFERALSVCADKGVPITETLAEALTPERDELREEQRMEVLWKLGDILQEQGDYHTATKKFTQAGDKGRAFKSLLKSGDTEKIIFFATMSRQAEVYVMAGNYLQALNWREDEKILKSIVTFYTKGQAFDLLANFYATTAQVEVDENRNYGNALKALQEAGRCVGRLTNAQRTAEQLQGAIGEVQKVIQLEECLERGEHQVVIAGGRNILAVANERPPVRYSDVMVLLFKALMATRQFPEALAQLRDLTRLVADWSVRGLIDREMIQRLSSEMDLPFESVWSAGDGRFKRQLVGEGADGGEEEIEEQVE